MGKTLHALANWDRASPRIYGQLRRQVHGRMRRTCRENIAHNTLPYNFARLLLLPQILEIIKILLGFWL
jgi:hypothetical protein